MGVFINSNPSGNQEGQKKSICSNDKQWLKVAEKRLKALQSGEAKSIPGGQVFENIQKRFSK
ncbi:MAG: hypothetical protein R6U28_12225 [Cyclonatronaceae bacterium]